MTWWQDVLAWALTLGAAGLGTAYGYVVHVRPITARDRRRAELARAAQHAQLIATLTPADREWLSRHLDLAAPPAPSTVVVLEVGCEREKIPGNIPTPPAPA